jgi:protein-tyrosine phosphatase
MFSDLYWIDATDKIRIAIMARPRAGDWLEDEVAHWERSGVGVVVSLLEPEEVDELELRREGPLCVARGIDFLSFPIPDRGLPQDVGQAMRFAAEVVDRGRPIAVHCRAGIGRSSIIAAAILVSLGVTPADALAAIQRARGVPIPDTDSQRDWVLHLARP